MYYHQTPSPAIRVGIQAVIRAGGERGFQQAVPLDRFFSG